jgi:hypothetical protein
MIRSQTTGRHLEVVLAIYELETATNMIRSNSRLSGQGTERKWKNYADRDDLGAGNRNMPAPIQSHVISRLSGDVVCE